MNLNLPNLLLRNPLHKTNFNLNKKSCIRDDLNLTLRLFDIFIYLEEWSVKSHYSYITESYLKRFRDKKLSDSSKIFEMSGNNSRLSERGFPALEPSCDDYFSQIIVASRSFGL